MDVYFVIPKRFQYSNCPQNDKVKQKTTKYFLNVIFFILLLTLNAYLIVSQTIWLVRKNSSQISFHGRSGKLWTDKTNSCVKRGLHTVHGHIFFYGLHKVCFYVPCKSLRSESIYVNERIQLGRDTSLGTGTLQGGHQHRRGDFWPALQRNHVCGGGPDPLELLACDPCENDITVWKCSLSLAIASELQWSYKERGDGPLLWCINKNVGGSKKLLWSRAHIFKRPSIAALIPLLV